MIGNYVTLQHIIEKVQRNVPSYAQFNIEECKEWIYEAVRKIGGRYATIPNVVKLTLENGRCRIPAYVENVVHVIYHPYPSVNHMSRQHGHNISSTPLIYQTTLTDQSTYMYTIIQGYIYSDMREGVLEVQISIFPMDDKGNPLVPDIEYYVQAITWYISERMMWKLYLEDKINDNKYQRVLNEWIFYCGAAKAGSTMPTQDEDLDIANSKLRVFPIWHRGLTAHDNTRNVPPVDFSNLNDLIETQQPAGIGLPLNNT